MFEISAITLSSRMPAVVIPPQAVFNPAAIHAASIDVAAVKPLNPVVSRDHSDRDEQHQLNKGQDSVGTRHIDRFA
ncbi:MAG: hypothetical protein R8K49_09510 [Mariprofundaceae bacterium]